MELNPEQQATIAKIAKEQKFINFKTNVEKGSNKGDNFVGIISRVTIEDNDKQLCVILKSANNSETIKKIQPTRKLFLREIYMYEKILTEYAAFEEENNISDRFTSYCNVFGTCDKENEEYVVLEDMRQKGYQMWNKKTIMNTGHIEAILVEHAKYHSISLAMSKKNPERFAELTKDLDDIFIGNKEYADVFLPFMKALMENAYNAVEGDLVALEALKKYEKSLPTLVAEVNPSENIIVSHGDSWCNNFLFKYEGEKSDKPVKVCIVDWQLSKLDSPAYDLAYVLCTNGSEAVLDNYQKYLKFYHETLRRSLKHFGCDVDEIFLYEDLEKMFKKYFKKIFWSCLLILKIQLCTPEETPDFEDWGKEDNKGEEIANLSLANIDEYHRRIVSIIRFMLKNNLF